MRSIKKARRNNTAWYSTAALAAVGGLAPTDAQADVISWTSGAVDSINGQVLYVNALTGATTNADYGSSPTGYQFGISAQYSFSQYDTNMVWDTTSTGGIATLGSTARPPQLLAGAPIGPAQAFMTLSALNSQRNLFYKPGVYSPTNSNFGLNSDGYLGLKFGNGPSYNYGWVELSTDGSGNVTVVAGAYDTTADETIDAGQTVPASVPEPASLLLLASGVAGLAAYRARRGRRLTV